MSKAISMQCAVYQFTGGILYNIASKSKVGLFCCPDLTKRESWFLLLGFQPQAFCLSIKTNLILWCFFGTEICIKVKILITFKPIQDIFIVTTCSRYISALVFFPVEKKPVTFFESSFSRILTWMMTSFLTLNIFLMLSALIEITSTLSGTGQFVKWGFSNLPVFIFVKKHPGILSVITFVLYIQYL